MTLYQRIYECVRRIPSGRVVAYGHVARAVNCGPRQVGYALAATPPDVAIPWHRVINSKGAISARRTGASGLQRALLEREGVVFDARGRVDFGVFGWPLEDVSSD